jgi:hypothetical protein
MKNRIAAALMSAALTSPAISAHRDGGPQGNPDLTPKEWTWGLWIGEAYDAGNRKRTPEAAVGEKNGRGHELLLLGCEGKRLDMADDPEETFFPEDSYHVGWIEWAESSGRHPIMMEPGEAGNSFEIDVSSERYKNIFQSKEFQICPQRESQDKDCRHFSTLGFKQAVAFVCKKRK